MTNIDSISKIAESAKFGSLGVLDTINFENYIISSPRSCSTPFCSVRFESFVYPLAYNWFLNISNLKGFNHFYSKWLCLHSTYYFSSLFFFQKSNFDVKFVVSSRLNFTSNHLLLFFSNLFSSSYSRSPLKYINKFLLDHSRFFFGKAQFLGLEVCGSGRFTRSQRATNFFTRIGKMPFSSISKPLLKCACTLNLKYGSSTIVVSVTYASS